LIPPNFFITELDKYLDIQKLEECHLEICAGIAQSQINISSRVIPHYEMSDEFESLIQFKNNENPRIASVANSATCDELTSEEEKSISHLNFEQRKKFLQLYKKAYSDGEFVRIKFTKKEFANDLFSTFHESMCEMHPNSQFFPKTLQYINSLPFIEIGRILIFVSYHYIHSDVHFDRKDNCFDGTNHFIWFNPFKNKSFFLVDENNEKKFIESKSAFFNTRHLHGSLPAKQMTYTLRVDGQLTKEFCESTGILWKQR
jgi:hypothetical protein